MKGWYSYIGAPIFWFAAIYTGSAADGVAVRQLIYKEIDGHQLNMTIYAPKHADTASLPAIIFYFGGGWNVGSHKVFEKQARYLASRGMVAFCPEYRVGIRHGTTVAECVKDARSAIRYVKAHAHELSVDPERIVAAGVSAGGHLAASLACIDGFDEASDDVGISTQPYALVLFCPALRIEAGRLNEGYRQRFAGEERTLSPYHHVRAGMPPTLILSGTADKQVPVADLRGFAGRMEEQGNECLLKEYDGQPHAFFHYDRNPLLFEETLRDAEVFLEKLLIFRRNSWLDIYMKRLSDGKNL